MNDKSGTITFTTFSALALWNHEITGQLSDGAWENLRPYDHWKFWCRLDAKKGDANTLVREPGHYPRRTGYKLTSLLEYIGDRMLNLGRWARAFQTADFDRSAAKYMPATFEEWKAKRTDTTLSEWQRKPFLISEEDAMEYYLTDYTEKELKEDLKRIKEAMKSLR